MVAKTLSELKKEDPQETSHDQVIEKVKILKFWKIKNQILIFEVVRYSLTTWPGAFSRKYELRGFTCLGADSEAKNGQITLEINHKTVLVKSLQGEEYLQIPTRMIKKCFLLTPR